jgi:hypothetical protein
MQQLLILKPQDVALLVKLLAQLNREWKQVDVALELGLSQGEVAKALNRLNKANLVNDKMPNRAAALEYLIHAVKYSFPIELGPLSIGVPTGISAPAHEKIVMHNQEDVYVWPYIHGKNRGQSIAPLYPNLAKAALKDDVFYSLMAAVEIIRLGRARERKLAEQFLERKLKTHGSR